MNIRDAFLPFNQGGDGTEDNKAYLDMAALSSRIAEDAIGGISAVRANSAPFPPDGGLNTLPSGIAPPSTDLPTTAAASAPAPAPEAAAAGNLEDPDTSLSGLMALHAPDDNTLFATEPAGLADAAYDSFKAHFPATYGTTPQNQQSNVSMADLSLSADPMLLGNAMSAAMGGGGGDHAHASLSAPRTAAPESLASGSVNASSGANKSNNSSSEGLSIYSFAQISFPDTVFHISTFTVVIGRNNRALKRARREVNANPELAIPGHPLSVSQAAVYTNSSMYSESCVDEESAMLPPEQPEGAGGDAVQPQQPPQEEEFEEEPPDSLVPPGQHVSPHTPGSANVDISRHMPDPDCTTFIAVHCPGSDMLDMIAKTKTISRKHMMIAYNKEKSVFEASPLHNNGFFHQDKLIQEGSVVLRSGDRLQISGLSFVFTISGASKGCTGGEIEPDDGAENELDGLDNEQMSFEFEGHGVENARDTSEESSPGVHGHEGAPQAPPELPVPVGAGAAAAQSDQPISSIEDDMASDLPVNLPEGVTMEDYQAFMASQPKKRGPGRPPKGLMSKRAEKDLKKYVASKSQSATLESPAVAGSAAGVPVPDSPTASATPTTPAASAASAALAALAASDAPAAPAVPTAPAASTASAVSATFSAADATAFAAALQNATPSAPVTSNASGAFPDNNMFMLPLPTWPDGTASINTTAGLEQSGVASDVNLAALLGTDASAAPALSALSAYNNATNADIPMALATDGMAAGQQFGPDGMPIQIKRKVGRPRKHPLPENAEERPEKRRYKPRKPKNADEDGQGDDSDRSDKAAGSKRKERHKTPPLNLNREDFSEEALQKPTKNYSTLIDEVLSEAPPEGLTLKQTYKRIMKKYPYYFFNVETKGWESSVRHNLIGNDAFAKDNETHCWKRVNGIELDAGKKRKANSPDRTTAAAFQNYGSQWGQQMGASNGGIPGYPQVALTHANGVAGMGNNGMAGRPQQSFPQPQFQQNPNMPIGAMAPAGTSAAVVAAAAAAAPPSAAPSAGGAQAAPGTPLAIMHQQHLQSPVLQQPGTPISPAAPPTVTQQQQTAAALSAYTQQGPVAPAGTQPHQHTMPPTPLAPIQRPQFQAISSATESPTMSAAPNGSNPPHTDSTTATQRTAPVIPEILASRIQMLQGMVRSSSNIEFPEETVMSVVNRSLGLTTESLAPAGSESGEARLLTICETLFRSLPANGMIDPVLVEILLKFKIKVTALIGDSLDRRQSEMVILSAINQALGLTDRSMVQPPPRVEVEGVLLEACRQTIKQYLASRDLGPPAP